MTEYRVVTNGEEYAIQYREKWLWWNWWAYVRCWEVKITFGSYQKAQEWIRESQHDEEVASRPWLPTDEHGQAIAPSNIAAQARQDGVIPPWPHPPEQQLEEIKEPTPPPIEVIQERESEPCR